MGKWINHIGGKFGELFVENFSHSFKRASNRGSRKYWLCACSCGNKIRVETQTFKKKHPSCGCLARRKLAERKTTHGGSRDPKRKNEYQIWKKIRDRCNVSGNRIQAECYVGINLCERWAGKDGFVHFFSDMGKRPSSNHSIDRINGRKGYSPENCRWATPKEQAINRKSVRFHRHNGILVCTKDMAILSGIDPKLAYSRIARGYREDEDIFYNGHLSKKSAAPYPRPY